MRVVAREIIYVAICAVAAFVVVQIVEDWVRMARTGRAERRSRRHHPSRQEGRYE